MTHAFPTRRSSDLISPIAASAGSEPMDDHSYDAGEMLDCVTDTVREHPIPVALAGLGLGWLLYAGLRRNGDAGLAQSEYPDYVDPAADGPAYDMHGERRGMRDRARERARSTAEGLRSRSEEHTSELQSLMRISYAVFCLKKK